MSFRYTIEHADASATVTTIGTLESKKEILDYVRILVKAFSGHGHKGVILDHSGLSGTVPLAWMYLLTERIIAEIEGVQEYRWAILGNEDRVNELQFFELTLRNRGLDMRAFTALDEARDWVEG